jgi:hypothetical protein
MHNHELDSIQDEPVKQELARPFLSSFARIRGALALFIVIAYVFGIAGIIFLPLWDAEDISSALNESINHAKDISSIFNGLVGMIVGYYFGKS